MGEDEPVSGHGPSEQCPSARRLPIDPDRPGSAESSRKTGPIEPGVAAHASGAARRAFLHPMTLAAIALGAGGRHRCRVELTRLIPPTVNGFPWPTFAANLIGAFVLGLVIVLVLDLLPPSRYVRPSIGTGFCGGLTTFSTLVVEIDLSVKAAICPGHRVLDRTLVAGMAASWAGMALAGAAASARGPRP